MPDYYTFLWLEESPIAVMIRDSTWLFPVIEAIHLVAFGVIGGLILVVDLRLLGWGLRGQPVTHLARSVRPYLIAGIAAMFATGIPLFLSEAVKCYYSQPFWIKMGALAGAILFTFTLRRRVVQSNPDAGSVSARIAALTSVALWATVAWGGRWIGFSG